MNKCGVDGLDGIDQFYKPDDFKPDRSGKVIHSNLGGHHPRGRNQTVQFNFTQVHDDPRQFSSIVQDTPSNNSMSLKQSWSKRSPSESRWMYKTKQKPQDLPFSQSFLRRSRTRSPQKAYSPSSKSISFSGDRSKSLESSAQAYSRTQKI